MTIHTPRCFTFSVFFTALAMLSMPSSMTLAQKSTAKPSATDIAKAKEYFLQGRVFFDDKKFKDAVDQFKESYKLSKNPILLYNIAFTHDQIGDVDLAAFYYKKFLRDTHKSAANRDLATTRLRTLNEQIAVLDRKAEGGRSAAKRPANAPKPSPPTRRSTATEFTHEILDEAPPGLPIDIVAEIPEGATWSVSLHYRQSGQATYLDVEMRHRQGELVARIPAAATKGQNIQYYIDVNDSDGTLLKRSGQPSSPNIIYMDKDAKPHYYRELNEIRDEDDPLGNRPKTFVTNTSNGDGIDSSSSQYNKLKWGTTGGSVALALLSTTFYLMSSSANSSLEEEANSSRTGDCSMAPCKQFAQKQKDLQSVGQTYETLGLVTLGLGITTAIAAGTLWYMDIGDDKDSSVSTTPIVGSDYVGAAATLRF